PLVVTPAVPRGRSGLNDDYASDPRRRTRTSDPSARRSTCGGRGRPLYREDNDAPYAPASRIATRSPRRRAGNTCVPSASVDSQIGPWTSAGSSAAADPPSTSRPSDVSATIG